MAYVIPQVAPEGKDQTLALQQELKAEGYDPGPLDGIYGPQTAAAVKARQDARVRGVTSSAASEAAREAAVKKAKANVAAAEKKVEIAPTPQAKQELVVAEQTLATLEPGFFGLGKWQLALALGGAAAVLAGVYLAVKGKRK